MAVSEGQPPPARRAPPPRRPPPPRRVPVARVTHAFAPQHEGQLGVTLTSLDVPVVSLGVATPFPSPRTAAPDMSQGVHFNIHNNIWNTNYVLWYPFVPDDPTIRSRFQLAFTSQQQYEKHTFLTA